ncbi:MAG: DUF6056 family protein [Clostridium sp.]|nr:DUF6056 family protein [Lachnoclostridium sp.]MCM1251776.1 DUF6056 family protein [Clostridium sp.]
MKTIQKMAACAGILFAVSVIPLLLLGKYNVMCIDDYDYGRAVHDVWMETGSLWQSVQAAVRQTGRFFMEWQGTYVSCFLMALCPMNFWYDTAFVVPILMIGMFAVSTFLFGRQILTKWLGSDKPHAYFMLFLILFLFYQIMEAPYEGIYWYNGSTHYILMESLLFFLVTLVSGCIWTDKKGSAAVWCVLACIDAVLVGGGNLITGLQAAVLLAFLLAFVCINRDYRKKAAYVLFPFLLFCVGFLCNILAPGNAIRSSLDTDVGYSAITSIMLSFYYAVVFMIKWTNLLVVLLWLALLPVMWRIGKESTKNFAHPVWVAIGAFCILSAMFTPTLYAVGMVGMSRVDNIIQMVYYLGLFFVTTYCFGWLNHHDAATQEEPERTALPGKTFGAFMESVGYRMTFICLLLMLIVWVLTPDKNTYTSISALRSLVNGDAETYYEEAMARHTIYTDENITDVIVKPYSARPALFDFEDLSEEEGNWLNRAVSSYYHKESVKIREKSD